MVREKEIGWLRGGDGEIDSWFLFKKERVCFRVLVCLATPFSSFRQAKLFLILLPPIYSDF